jgi:hypothetical protein
VTIGVVPDEEVDIPLRRRLFPISDAIDENFSFDTLTEVLRALGESKIVALTLVLPAGLASRNGSCLEKNQTTGQRRLVHVKEHTHLPGFSIRGWSFSHPSRLSNPPSWLVRCRIVDVMLYFECDSMICQCLTTKFFTSTHDTYCLRPHTLHHLPTPLHITSIGVGRAE